ncbi:hypothetical protein ECANGB1_446 [Enterospora canceri]|uniref:Uncharacterized protein n=1 Tax=Enterospora canceri TaxID=1081671 RepID=A0A1Y1S801_9MICR|nr:hypothetical protein ECANGB1_446 [Enterospora canceri]
MGFVLSVVHEYDINREVESTATVEDAQFVANAANISSLALNNNILQVDGTGFYSKERVLSHDLLSQTAQFVEMFALYSRFEYVRSTIQSKKYHFPTLKEKLILMEGKLLGFRMSRDGKRMRPVLLALDLLKTGEPAETVVSHFLSLISHKISCMKQGVFHAEVSGISLTRIDSKEDVRLFEEMLGRLLLCKQVGTRITTGAHKKSRGYWFLLILMFVFGVVSIGFILVGVIRIILRKTGRYRVYETQEDENMVTKKEDGKYTIGSEV